VPTARNASMTILPWPPAPTMIIGGLLLTQLYPIREHRCASRRRHSRGRRYDKTYERNTPCRAAPHPLQGKFQHLPANISRQPAISPSRSRRQPPVRSCNNDLVGQRPAADLVVWSLSIVRSPAAAPVCTGPLTIPDFGSITRRTDAGLYVCPIRPFLMTASPLRPFGVMGE
jgi:hypothetical protein